MHFPASCRVFVFLEYFKFWSCTDIFFLISQGAKVNFAKGNNIYLSFFDAPFENFKCSTKTFDPLLVSLASGRHMLQFFEFVSS